MKKLTRRRALEVMGSAGVAMLAGCSSSATTPSTTASPSTASPGTTGSSACAITPSETEGPYPDRTGMLNNPAFHRRDITEGRPGIPLAVTMTLVNAKASCAPVANAVVEVWHCDVTGTYSEYGQGAGQTYLRGLQTTDASGAVTFNTIYPGWYAGRATHIHVEVYVNGASVKVDADRVPGKRLGRSVCVGRVRLARPEFDDQCPRQRVFRRGCRRTGDGQRQSGQRLHGHVDDRHLGLTTPWRPGPRPRICAGIARCTGASALGSSRSSSGCSSSRACCSPTSSRDRETRCPGDRRIDLRRWSLPMSASGLAQHPDLDVQQYVRERYGAIVSPVYVVMKDGRVAGNATDPLPDDILKAAAFSLGGIEGRPAPRAEDITGPPLVMVPIKVGADAPRAGRRAAAPSARRRILGRRPAALGPGPARAARRDRHCRRPDRRAGAPPSARSRNCHRSPRRRRSVGAGVRGRRRRGGASGPVVQPDGRRNWRRATRRCAPPTASAARCWRTSRTS